MNPRLDFIWQWRSGLLARLISVFLLLLSFVYFLIVGLMIWKGGVWAYIIYAERPLAHFAGGLLCLFGWYYLRKGHQNDRQAWVRIAGRIILITVSFSFSFLIGEIGIRMILIRQQESQSLSQLQKHILEKKQLHIHSAHPLAAIIQPSTNKSIVYELQPGLKMEFGHRSLEINNQGMRESRDYEMERRPGSVRIVGVGDSGMFGWDTDQGQDYLDVLETNLNRRGDGTIYEVLNLAVPGYNTALEVEMLRGRGLAYHPDIVVIGWCENDYGLPFFMMKRENYRRTDISYLYDMLFNRARLVEVVYGEQMGDIRDIDRKDLPKDEEAIAGVKNSLLQLKQLSEEKNFHVLVFGPSKDPTIGNLCKEANVPFFNTRNDIPLDQYPSDWSIQFMHPAPEGHRILAEYLEKTLQERGWLRPKP